MDRDEIISMLCEKILSKDFHWLGYHFSHYKNGYEHELASSIVNCSLNVENRIKGFAEKFSDKLASLANSHMNTQHYEQIIQLLAELLVFNHLSNVFSQEAEFLLEPIIVKNGKNPELGIKTNDRELYVEVKCREYIYQTNKRAKAVIELPTRISGFPEVAKNLTKGEEEIVYPRDNVVKDFLISANSKFKDFKIRNPNALTALVIVWDDYIYEVISSLLSGSSGLLTENSYYRDDDGRPVKFEYINSIILIRHSHHIVRATRDESLSENLSHPLEWPNLDDDLPKAYVPVNTSPDIDDYLCQLFQACHIEGLSQVAADYRPQDIVFRL